MKATRRFPRLAQVCSLIGTCSVGSVASAQPPASLWGGMAYDVERGVIVLHGGVLTDPEQSPLVLGTETWTLDVGGWQLKRTDGPAWYSSRLAYDSGSRSVVAYAALPVGLWIWNGDEWRYSGGRDLWLVGWHALSYDTVRSRIVLHGTTRWDLKSSRTWEWVDGDWVVRYGAGPLSERYATAMVYDQRRGMCVAYGEDIWSYNTYEWDGFAWTARQIPGPEAIFHTAMAYDSRRGVTVLFGGESLGTPAIRQETWEYDGVSWRMVANAGPAPRLGHAMAYDERRGVTVLFGGWDRTQLFGDTWEWDGKQWREFTPVVSCYADCDTTSGQFVLDIFDFLCFQNRYVAGASYACDCDTSTSPGVCDIFDFLCFQNAFAAGCP